MSSEAVQFHKDLEEYFRDPNNIAHQVHKRPSISDLLEPIDYNFDTLPINPDNNILVSMFRSLPPSFTSIVTTKTTIRQTESFRLSPNYTSKSYEIKLNTGQDSAYFVILYEECEAGAKPVEGYALIKFLQGSGVQYQEFKFTYDGASGNMVLNADSVDTNEAHSRHNQLAEQAQNAIEKARQAIREQEDMIHQSALSLLREHVKNIKSSAQKGTQYTIKLPSFISIYDGIKNNRPLDSDPSETHSMKDRKIEELSGSLEPLVIDCYKIDESYDARAYYILTEVINTALTSPKDDDQQRKQWVTFDEKTATIAINDPKAMLLALSGHRNVQSKTIKRILDILNDAKIDD